MADSTNTRDRGSRHMNSRAITGGFLVMCFGFCGSVRCQQEPAGEGRPITPAGSLVMDAATHLPAVGAMPDPLVIQNIYFPTPQSANVGVAFSPAAGADGNFEMYVSGGFENKVWIFRFNPKAAAPVQPESGGPDTKVQASSFEISKPGEVSRPDYNKGKAALYPTGLALTPDGNTLVTANNLGDNVTIVRRLHDTRRMERLDLHHPGKP